MENPYQLAAMRILAAVAPPAYFAFPALMPLIAMKMVNLSIKFGNNSASAFGYAMYAFLLCGVVNDIESSLQFSQLVLNLVDKFNAKEIKSKVLLLAGHFIKPWQESLQTSSSLLKRAYQVGLEVGDLEFAGYSASFYCCDGILAGKELVNLNTEILAYSDAIAKLKQEHILHQLYISQQMVLNLLTSLDAQDCCYQLTGEAYDEIKMAPVHERDNNRTTLAFLYLAKLQLSYLFGNYEQARENAFKAEQYLDGVVAMPHIVVFYFYDSLVKLAQFRGIRDIQQSPIQEQLVENQAKMSYWADNAPMNCLHKFYLIEAEKCRVLGQKLEAIELYDKAISGAKENGYIQEEALANELLSKLYLDWGKEKAAIGYMQEAYYCYARWGAKAKTDDLENKYPQLLQTILQQRQFNINRDETIPPITQILISQSTHTSSTGITSISDILDFTSVLKAAQAISGSIELDELINNLTKIILKNSGAKKSILILPQKNTWEVKAITFISYENKPEGEIQNIMSDELVDTSKYIPIKIINYVKNTLNTVVIDNCQTDIPGLIGEYMLKHQPKSVLCKPIVNQGHLVAVLYLENQVTSGVFTLNSLQVINLLSSQAAISLENARLYQQAQQALKDLQQAQLQIVQSEKMSALGNLVAGVAHEMNNPLAFIANTLKQAKPILSDITEHLKIYQESLPNKSEEILDHEEEIDLDYTLEDFPKMIDAMAMASDRLKNISTSLRTFSRADKDYKVLFNIHHGLDSTILILKHRLKANEQRPAIEVVKEYGNLPSIECFPGQLNQVFMNILANAIDALDESNTGRKFYEIKTNPNKITVKTLVENNQVKISIADNGKGMSEDVKQKIFDHLFTTKDVGKGTGLGLAIARQIIVEKHGGSIEVDSASNQGTEFTICLSVNC